MSIHPLAVIDAGAVIPASCTIGPFCTVGAEVELGEHCELVSHVSLTGPTRLGSQNKLFPFASVGQPPQDLSYKGEATRLEIGDRNHFREFVTIHRGTVKGGGLTRIGSDNLFMACAHVAHDCVVGNNVIMANAATLAGHVVVEDFSVVGAFCAVHQFTTIGKYAYIGAGTMITQDVMPFSKTSAERNNRAFGANTLGLERRGFTKERLRKIQHAFRLLLASKLNTSQAIERLRGEGALGEDVEMLVAFIEKSTRGVVK